MFLPAQDVVQFVSMNVQRGLLLKEHFNTIAAGSQNLRLYVGRCSVDVGAHLKKLLDPSQGHRITRVDIADGACIDIQASKLA